MNTKPLGNDFLIEDDILMPITGHKMQSILLRRDGILLMNKSATDPADFMRLYEKSRLLYSVTKIIWPDIRNISRIENKQGIKLNHKGFVFRSSKKFVFDNPGDIPRFFEILENKYHFRKSRQQLTSLQSSRGMWFSIITVLLVTAFCYWQVTQIEQSDHRKPTYAKGLMFEAFISFLGKGGVLGVGAAILTALLFRFRTLFNKPEVEIIYYNPSYVR